MTSVFSEQIKNLSDFQKVNNKTSDLKIIELNYNVIECLEQIRTVENEGFTKASLLELANSMKNDGQIEPIIVRVNPNIKDNYIMVAGERRLKAAKLLDLPLKAIVLAIDEEQARRIQIAENIHRENLSQKEIAKAVFDDKEKLNTLEAVAEIWHKSINWVSQMIKFHEVLLNPKAISAKLVEENITSDITAITDMDKLEKLDLDKAIKTLDKLKADDDINARKTIRENLKEVKDETPKKENLDNIENIEKENFNLTDKTKTLKNKKNIDTEYKSLDELLEMLKIAIVVTEINIECKTDKVEKIIIVIKDSDDKVQNLVLNKCKFTLTHVLTNLFKNLFSSKLDENFKSNIIFI